MTQSPSVQITTILRHAESDSLLKDLAVLTSERGVVFFRSQELSFQDQTEFVDRVAAAAGRPESSGLHVHPSTEEDTQFGALAYEISSEKTKEQTDVYFSGSEIHSQNWHSDVTFEPVPADYSVLKLRKLPRTGGDTLWASGYEVYERLSPAMQRFVSGLTATHEAKGFKDLAAAGKIQIRTHARGSPFNIGNDLRAVHPVIRTHPVTGWRTVFANKEFTTRVNELSRDESDVVLAHLTRLCVENHDLQVRYRWEQNDVALWDNRCTFHSGTMDYDGDEVRLGERATSVGERPFLDGESVSRRTALGLAPPLSRRGHLSQRKEE